MEAAYGYAQVNRKTGEKRVHVMVYRDEEFDRSCFYRSICDARMNHPGIEFRKRA